MKIIKSSPTDPIEGTIHIAEMEPTELSVEENVSIRVTE